MTDLRKAAQIALDALETKGEHHERVCVAIEALRQALAQDHGFDRTASHMAGEYVDASDTSSTYVDKNEKRKHEPVAYADPLDVYKDGNWDTFICKHSSENHEGTRFKVPLYTAPPKREWVGLTDEEIHSTSKNYALNNPTTPLHFARAIEAKLKEKNT